MSSGRIFVVLPVFDEEAALRRLLPDLAALGPMEIIAVDDGSTDGSAAVLKALDHPGVNVTVLAHSLNQGLGRTMRDGLRHAVDKSGPDDVIVTMDADNTHPADRIPLMLEQIRNGADVVVASRYQRGSRVTGVSRSRRLFSWVCSLLFRLTAPIPGIRDYTCGYRAMRAGLLKKAMVGGTELVTETGFASMAEILLRLRSFSPVCREVPLALRYDRKPTRSKMPVGRTIADLLRMLRSSRYWSSPATGKPQESQPTQETEAR